MYSYYIIHMCIWNIVYGCNCDLKNGWVSRNAARDWSSVMMCNFCVKFLSFTMILPSDVWHCWKSVLCCDLILRITEYNSRGFGVRDSFMYSCGNIVIHACFNLDFFIRFCSLTMIGLFLSCVFWRMRCATFISEWHIGMKFTLDDAYYCIWRAVMYRFIW